jgi:hypothetical protein
MGNPTPILILLGSAIAQPTYPTSTTPLDQGNSWERRVILKSIFPHLKSMAKLTLDIPDALLSQLESMGQPIQLVMLKALEQYVQSREKTFLLTQTETWQLCGSLNVSEVEEKYVTGHDEQGKPITNYAEHIDDILYNLGNVLPLR